MEDFKSEAWKAIVVFLTGKEEVLVADLIEYMGPERLRVYPILMELLLEDKLEVLEETELGGFVKVRLK